MIGSDDPDAALAVVSGAIARHPARCAVPDDDLDSLGLPDCPAPERVPYKFAFEGTHWAYSDATVPNTSVVFDIPVARVALPREYSAVMPCDSLEVTSTSGRRT